MTFIQTGLFFILKRFITYFPLSMFEKGLDRITCSLCLLQTNTSLSLSVTHIHTSSFPPYLVFSLSEAKPPSLAEECGRTC